MYRVLISDDEPIMVASLKQIIESKLNQVEIIGTAKNGRETIEKCHSLRPDILITDIRMPGINGLDAIRDLKRTLPDLYCIILSAYDYFDYAKDAVDLGVNAYLLKPVNEFKLMETMHEAMAKVDSIKRRFSQELAFREQIELMRPTLERSMMMALKSPETTGEEIQHFFQLLGYDEHDHAVATFAIKCDDPTYHQSLLDHIHKQFPDIIGHVRSTHLALLAFIDTTTWCDASHDLDLLESTQVLLQEAHESIIRQLADTIVEKSPLRHGNFLIGTGIARSSSLDAVESYQESCAALEVLSSKKDSTSSTAQLNQRCTCLKYDNLTSMESCITNGRAPHGIILKADTYMAAHFAEEITLDDISKAVSLSPFYFSRLYKDETGVNFIHKLTEIRIEEAKRLLVEEDLSLKEVSQCVGYPDPNYLSKLFKRMTGLTATEYKDKYRR